ncbi:MAG: inositol monophosphatase [Bacteroides sp.]|nr:inositol monophosphatase [Bacteroides sp.]
MELNHFLNAAIEMAKAAGKIQLEYFRSAHLNIQTKSNEYDVVTAADKASEKIIKDYIHSLFPDHGIISEESTDENANNEWRWVIDPLDGTTNFSQGLPVFSVSIALEYNKEAVLGVVFAPYLNEMFHSIKGKGAFLNNNRIKCSEKDSLTEAVIATGVPYDKMINPDNNIKEIAELAPKVRGIRRYGSAALDLSYVAAGFLDGYWELNLNLWDVAAGRLIAHEAGAVITSIRKNRNFSILAANSSLIPTLLDILDKT